MGDKPIASTKNRQCARTRDRLRSGLHAQTARAPNSSPMRGSLWHAYVSSKSARG